jgi:formimidoylglutamate deiminase
MSMLKCLANEYASIVGIVDLLFERALLPTGIARRVAISVADDGTLTSVAGDAPQSAGTPVSGLALCGMPNLHSHAFQRGIAGATETAGAAQSSFWGWRETMYRFVGRLGPDDAGAIATLAYLEMLEAGYTSVAEFHYLHHQPNGRPYPDAASMAAAVRAAAQRVGIRQVLLPCLYLASDFGPQPPLASQRRFVLDTGAFLRLFQQLEGAASALQSTGVALHSLRAVPLSAVREVIAALPADVPIHIHVCEQQREVDACLKFAGRTPIEYLLDSVAVDRHWCLVHATHASPSELQAVARSQAVVGLCPTTEANLGDGIFPLDDFVGAGGRFGIGSDSQVSIDPREELRAAEYALRLQRRRRGLNNRGGQQHCGTSLYSLASLGGAQALGLSSGELIAGAAADIVVVDTDQAQFAGMPDEALLDAHIFAPRPNAVRDVMIAGRWVVRAGRHPQREQIIEAYRRTVEGLLQ